MLYNRAKFLQNGSCGYVLKPGFMTDKESVYSPIGSNMEKIVAHCGIIARHRRHAGRKVVIVDSRQ